MKQLTFVFLFGIASLAQSASPGIAATPIAIIPFELVVNHLYVQASLNSSPLSSVLVDSGAPIAIVDRSRSIQLGLPTSGDILLPGFGNQNPTMGQKTVINRIGLDGVTLDNITAISVPLDFFSQLVGHTTDAVIGADLFNRYVVEMDYLERVLRLYDPDNYIELGGGCQLPLLLDTYPMVHAQFIDSDGKSIDAALVLDTGSNYLVVTRSFGDAHPNLPLDGKTIDAPTRKMLSGVARLRVGRVRSINLGGCVINNPVAFFSQDVGGAGAGTQMLAGYAGISILQQFMTVFDYRRHLVTFKGNPNREGVLQYDMTGIHILATGPSFHHFTVDQVISKSPAARRGIQVGDTVESANHIQASKLSLDDLDKLFQRPGSLRLTISRNGKQLKKKLKLKPMI